ncbi:MAG: hypothetical protein ACOCU2_02340 [Bacillota bacterium]
MDFITDVPLYLNIVFLSLIGFGALMGFLRGFRNSLYSLIVKVIFFGLFFLTIDVVVNQLWTLNIPQLGSLIGSFSPDAAGASSLSEALPIVLENLLGDQMADSATNEEILAFVTGLALFIVKIVYAIIYFTVFYALYRLIFFIVKLIIFGKAEKNMTSRALGAGVGAANGALSVFITLIILGGVMSIAGSLVSIIDDTGTGAQVIVYETVADETDPDQGESTLPQDELNMLIDLVDAYENNEIVNAFETIQITDEQTGVKRGLNLYLFDSVFSFNYKENQISIRKELQLAAELVGTVYNSEYYTSNDLTDITSDEVQDVFNKLSQSDLFTSLIPLAIEVGADYSEIDLDSYLAEQDIDLYTISWDEEIQQLGGIAVVVVDIINHSAILEEGNDLETVSFSGEQVTDLFDALSDSGLMNLAAYVAMEPLLEQAGEDLQAVITVPEDLEWEDEFTAMGSVVSEIVDTGVTISDFNSGDPMDLFSTLSTVDFTVMTNSKIISHALVNVVNGAGGVGLDVLVVPDDIEWFDEDGNVVADSELEKILLSFNEIAAIAGTVDFDNLDLNVFNELDVDSINVLIDSQVLESTIGSLIMDELSETLTIPLIAQKEILVDGSPMMIVRGTEVSDIFDAVKVLEIADFNNLEFDMSLLTSLAVNDTDQSDVLDEDKADRLFASDIIHATLSETLFDLMDDTSDSDVLVVPYKNAADEDIQFVRDGIRYITRDEIVNVLAALIALELDDFDNIETLDIDKLIDKSDVFLDSAILHATVTDQLFDQAEGESGFIVVPYYKAAENGDPETAIQFTVGEGEVDTETSESKAYTYIEKTEIIALLDSLEVLEITSVTSFDGSLDLGLLVEETGVTPVLDSAILHASVSKQILDLDESDDPNGLIIVPHYDESETLIRIHAGATESTEKQTVFIEKAEIQAMINAIDLLLADDQTIQDFSGDFDLGLLVEETGVTSVLDSAILHATISKQVIDLDESDDPNGLIIVPHYTALDHSDPDTAIRLRVGNGETDDFGNNMETVFIIKDEIQAAINGLDLLLADGQSFTDFTGDVDLGVLVEETGTTPALNSSILQATMSKQIIDLDDYHTDPVNGTIVVPYEDELGNDIRLLVREGQTDPITAESIETEYLTKDEIQAVINGFMILFDTENNFSEFSGNIDLSILVQDDNADTVLNSALVRASMSKQVIKLDDTDDVIVVPYISGDGSTTQLRLEADYDGDAFEYIVKDELIDMIFAIDVLGEGDIQTFDGNISLSTIYDPDATPAPIDERDTLLDSSVIHATISDQMTATSSFIIPTRDFDDTKDIEIQTSYLTHTNDFIDSDEIRNMIEILDLFGIEEVNDFTGGFDLTVLDDTNGKNTLLSSAIMHATISDTLRSLDDDDDVIILPNASQDTLTTVRHIVSSDLFVDDTEIGNLIDALLLMDYTDLDSFASEPLNSEKFFTSRDDLLLSHTIHATISNKMINETNDMLIVPNYENDGVTEIRIENGSDLYVEIDEVKGVLDALEILNLEDFTNINIHPGNILEDGVDYNALVSGSVTIQATVAKSIIDIALDETAPFGSGQLIVPTFFRSSIDVGSGTETQIEQQELIDLLTGVEALGLTDFDSDFDATAITNMDESELDTLVTSGSIHISIDNMLRDNDAIEIPDKAIVDTATASVEDYYDITAIDVTQTDEVVNFILAANKLVTGGSDFTNVSFDITAISNLSTTDRDIVLTSMLVRATLTPEIEDAASLDPGYTLEASDYEDDDTTKFLTKQGVLDYINYFETL